MIITFLGTGTSQGVPVIACTCPVCTSTDFRDKRLRASIHIQTEQTSIIIDSGPDFRQQVLRERISSLDGLIYTHEHKDHIAGMDDVRGFNYLHQEPRPVTLYATARVFASLKRDFYYAFSDDKYPGIPIIESVEIDHQPFRINELTITPIEVMHHRLPVFGYRIGDFTYITDANYIAPDQMEKIKGSRILVLNALQKTEHISHYTLSQALEVIGQIQPEKAYLTHMGHRMGMHRDIDRELPENVRLAYDGLKLSL